MTEYDGRQTITLEEYRRRETAGTEPRTMEMPSMGSFALKYLERDPSGHLRRNVRQLLGISTHSGVE